MTLKVETKGSLTSFVMTDGERSKKEARYTRDCAVLGVLDYSSDEKLLIRREEGPWVAR